MQFELFPDFPSGAVLDVSTGAQHLFPHISLPPVRQLFAWRLLRKQHSERCESVLVICHHGFTGNNVVRPEKTRPKEEREEGKRDLPDNETMLCHQAVFLL